ncbi:MAG: hypothetical protein ACFCGT_05765 [Sandaracinaceae bacterium]
MLPAARVVPPLVLGLALHALAATAEGQSAAPSDPPARETSRGEDSRPAPEDGRDPGPRRPPSPTVRRPILRYRAVFPGQAARGRIDQSIRLEIGVPVRVDESFVIPIAGYRWDRLGPAVIPSTQGLDLHRVFAGAVGVLRFNREWALSGVIDGSYASDLRGYAADAWGAFASAGAVWQPGPDRPGAAWSLLFGVTVVRIDTDYLPLPTLGFLYRPAGGRIAIDVILPREIEVRAHLGGPWELFGGVVYEALGWRGQGGDRWTLFEVRAATGARYLHGERFYTEVAASAFPFRRGRHRRADGSVSTADSAPAFSLGASFGVRLDGS